MKDGGAMSRIERLSSYMEEDAYLVGRKMMVKYVNGDINLDMDKHIKKTLSALSDKTLIEKVYAKNVLEYWKYLLLLEQGETEKAKRCLKEEYDKLNPEAVAHFAYYFYTASGCCYARNTKKAIRLFNEAINYPNMFVEYLVAEAFIFGKENDKEACKSAIPYYEKALKKGVIFARYNLANCYLVTKTNLEQAKELFEKSYAENADEKIKEVNKLLMNQRK